MRRLSECGRSERPDAHSTAHCSEGNGAHARPRARFRHDGEVRAHFGDDLRNLLEIEREADANAMRFFTATTADAAADRVIEFAG